MSRSRKKQLEANQILERIILLRGHKVMLDKDLAALYGVETKVLLQSVKRNNDRFPSDFMFQLTEKEWECLRSQFVTSNVGRGGRRYTPYVFTEQGVAMLSSVLHSQQAIAAILSAIRELMKPPVPTKKRPIGFVHTE